MRRDPSTPQGPGLDRTRRHGSDGSPVVRRRTSRGTSSPASTGGTSTESDGWTKMGLWREGWEVGSCTLLPRPHEKPVGSSGPERDFDDVRRPSRSHDTRWDEWRRDHSRPRPRTPLGKTLVVDYYEKLMNTRVWCHVRTYKRINTPSIRKFKYKIKRNCKKVQRHIRISKNYWDTRQYIDFELYQLL